MAFRGKEVKPGTPVRVHPKDIGGAFILTQATLGNGTSSKETRLLCECGDSDDCYILYTFLPEKSESCFLSVIFDEEDHVRFTADGPTSVYISGYIQDAPQDLDDDVDGHDDCGEDVASSESEESDYNSEESSDYDFNAGVEVKPGTPLTIDCEKLGGKLILTEATLGNGSSQKKSILQCIEGGESPIFVCTLLPQKSESCTLRLEFDKEDDVKLSVVGPTSIFLFGFVKKVSQDSDDEGDGNDASGEDIVGTESKESDSSSEEFSGFSDDDLDDDLFMCPPSTVPNSGEIADDQKASSEIGTSKQSKKNEKQLADTKNDQKALVVVNENNGGFVLESEDEDGFPDSEKSEPNSENGDSKTEDDKRKKTKTKTNSKDDVEHDRSGIYDIDHSEELKSDTLAGKKRRKNKQKSKSKRKKKQKNETKTNDDTKKVVPEVKKTPTTDTKQSKAKKAKGELVEKGRSDLLVHALGKPEYHGPGLTEEDVIKIAREVAQSEIRRFFEEQTKKREIANLDQLKA